MHLIIIVHVDVESQGYQLHRMWAHRWECQNGQSGRVGMTWGCWRAWRCHHS